MSRLDRLTDRRPDLLVIGGGIHGLFAAYDAALRGITVALVDRADFGGGLSFNHQRTIHGGLRALQSGNLAKSREQIRERRTWALIAPHFLRPLPFLIGTYRWSKRSRTAIRAGFKLYDLAGRGRNHGVLPELHLPRTRLESAAATRRLFPGILEAGLSGGAIWYDYQTKNPERLTWTVALAAQAAGATLVNYAEVVGALTAGGRVTGARVRDGVTGEERDVPASAVLIAAGSGTGHVMRMFGVSGAPPLVRAMNILLNRPARDIATAAPSPSRRMLIAVPWRGSVLYGTHQSNEPVSDAETAPPDEAVDAFLKDVNATFPRVSATRADIKLIHHGLVPAVVRGGRADLMPEPLVIRHGGQQAGLVSLIGVKYTTSRLAAKRAVDAICGEFGRTRGHCRTGSTTLPHADIADVEGRLVEASRDLGISLDRELLDHLAGWYGTEAPALFRHAAQLNGGFDRISDTSPVIAAEVSWAISKAQAVTVDDVIYRRTALGADGLVGEDVIVRVRSAMQNVKAQAVK